MLEVLVFGANISYVSQGCVPPSISLLLQWLTHPGYPFTYHHSCCAFHTKKSFLILADSTTTMLALLYLGNSMSVADLLLMFVSLLQNSQP